MNNNYIEELAERMNNIHIINLNSLDRCYFTRHCLHINNKGKLKVAEIIINSLEKKTQDYNFLGKGKKKLKPDLIFGIFQTANAI